MSLRTRSELNRKSGSGIRPINGYQSPGNWPHSKRNAWGGFAQFAFPKVSETLDAYPSRTRGGYQPSSENLYTFVCGVSTEVLAGSVIVFNETQFPIKIDGRI